MKTRVLLLTVLVSVFLFGCTLVKENQMKKDAERMIEVVVENGMLSSEFLIFDKAMQQKYQGEEALEFVKILKQECRDRKARGENIGGLELLLIY